MLRFLITLILLKLVTAGNRNGTCKPADDRSPYYKLFDYLFCDYDHGVRPTDKRYVTSVFVFLPKIYLRYDEYKDTVEAQAQLHLSWKDRHLTWNPTDFENVSKISVSTDQIWIPKLRPLSTSIEKHPTNSKDQSCTVDSIGQVTCSQTTKFTVRCASDLKHWPYHDLHACLLQIVFSNGNHDQVTWAKDVKVSSTTSADPWKFEERELYHSISIVNNQTMTSVALPYFMYRVDSPLFLVLPISVTALTAMTLNILWFRVQSTERLILACVNVLGHTLFLQWLNGYMPNNGERIPIIFVYFVSSTILAALALILTCWLRKLAGRKKSAPAWLTSPVSAIRSSKVGQVLSINIMDSRQLLDDDDNARSSDNTQTMEQQWEYIVAVIGWISFFGFLLIYIILLIIFLPYK